MRDDRFTVAVALIGVLIGATISGGAYTFTHKSYHEIIKTNIGEFILRDGKIYTVYEMQRDMMGVK